MNIIFAIIGGVAAVTFLVLWRQPGRVRPDGSQYHLVPSTWMFYALAVSLVFLGWSFIPNDLLGPYTNWIIGIGIGIAAFVVAFAHRAGAIIAIVAVAALLLFGPLQATIAWASSAVATPQSETTPQPANLEDLSVDENNTVTYPQRYLGLLTEYGYGTEVIEGQTVPVFQPCSTQYADKLPWTDAVCPPITPMERDTITARILGSPDYAAMIGSGLYRFEVMGLDGTTTTLGEHNPWLADFADPANINDWSQSAMAAEGADRLQYTHKVLLVAVLFELLADEGVQKGLATDWNIHLVTVGNGGVLTVDENDPFGTIPEFEFSPKQYKGEFLVFSVTYKGHDGCYGRIGINTGDGRIAGFTCETPELVETPTPTTPPTTEKCTPPANPGDGSTWDQSTCKWVPPTSTCEKGDKPGDGYTWDQNACKWQPPTTEKCEKTADPGDGSTWNPDTCKWDPPTNKCEQGNPPGPAGDYRWDPDACEWVKLDKPDSDNPTDIEGVNEQDQTDDAEETATDQTDPADPTETPGTSIPSGDDGTSTDVDGDTGESVDTDSTVGDDANTGDEEAPSDGGIIDPDAAPAAGVALLSGLVAFPWKLRRRVSP